MIPVKICGITSIQDALTCVANGVSALGFVFAPSQRQVSVAQAFEIARQVPPFITKIGVFVNEDPLLITEVLTDCQLDLVQLHGAESLAISEILPNKVIKVFKAGRDQPNQVWRGLPFRAVLIDTYSAESAGGTGLTFDWSLCEGFRVLGYPVILAGGLNPGNVQQAIKQARPDAVDLSSGVEKEPGIKDPVKIREFMQRIQQI